MRVAVIATLATGVVHAFTPTLFFNLTLSPLDGMFKYRPARSKEGDGVLWDTDKTWNTTFSETDMATFKPGDVGQGRAVKHGYAWPGTTTMDMPLPFKAIYIHGTAPDGVNYNGSYSMGGGIPNVRLFILDWEATPPNRGKFVNNSGDFVASLEYDAPSNRTARLEFEHGGNMTGEVTVTQVDVTLGIESSAISFDAVPTRTEPFSLNGAVNPFFNYVIGSRNLSDPTAHKGSITFTSAPDGSPLGVVVLTGEAALVCTIPPNSSLVTISAFTGPDAPTGGRLSVWLFPPPPLPYESPVVYTQYEPYESALWDNFTTPVTAFLIVLDPSVSYTLSIRHIGHWDRYGVYERTAFQSVTFYSSTDKPPEGGGPATPHVTLPAPPSTTINSVIGPTYTGEVIGSTAPLPGPTRESGSRRSRSASWIAQAAAVAGLVVASL